MISPRHDRGQRSKPSTGGPFSRRARRTVLGIVRSVTGPGPGRQGRGSTPELCSLRRYYLARHVGLDEQLGDERSGRNVGANARSRRFPPSPLVRGGAGGGAVQMRGRGNMRRACAVGRKGTPTLPLPLPGKGGGRARAAQARQSRTASRCGSSSRSVAVGARPRRGSPLVASSTASGHARPGPGAAGCPKSPDDLRQLLP